MARALGVSLFCWAIGAMAATAEPALRNPVWIEEPNAAAFVENYPSQAAHQADGGVRRRTRHLGHFDVAGGPVDCHDVSKRAAGIDSYAQACHDGILLYGHQCGFRG